MNIRQASRQVSKFENSRVNSATGRSMEWFDGWCAAHADKPRRYRMAVWESGSHPEMGNMPHAIRALLGL